MIETRTDSTHNYNDISASLTNGVVSYLSYLGLNIDAASLVAGLPLVSEDLSEEVLGRAVGRVGYSVQWESISDLRKVKFPCCVALSDSEFATVIDFKNNSFVVINGHDFASFREIPAKQLAQTYSGRVFKLRPRIELLQERHSISTDRGHWFWGKIFLRKTRVMDIVLASFFANLIAVVVSLFALQVYDRVIPGQSEATLWVLVGGVMIAVFFEAMIRVARSRLMDQTGKEAEIQITRDLFEKLIGMRLDRRPASPGALVHMVREFAAVREFFTTASVGVVADIPFVFIFLAVIYGIAGPIVWIIVAGAILTVIPSLLLQGKMAQLSKETLGGMSSASRLLTEVVYGAETVKVTRAAPRLQKNWEEITILNAVKTTEQRELSSFLTFWAAAMQQCTYVLAVVGGVYMVFAGEFTTGSIIAVSILSTRTLSPITQLAGILSRWQNMKTSLAGLDMIMKSEQERVPSKVYLRRPRLQGKIEIKKATFTHVNTENACLEIENFKVLPGTRVAVLGENGSGKSTMLRMLSGIYQVSNGEITIDGIDIRQIDPTDLYQNIGYLTQEIRLYRGTIRENLITDSRVFTDDVLMDALHFGGLDGFVKSHPKGLDFEIVDGGDGLSIGQKQSLGLARIYLQDPSIVLLDEPTAALDQQLERNVVNRLGHWLESRTCIIATHRMPILSIVDRVAVMQKGQIVIEGERDFVLKQLLAKNKA